MIIGIYTASAGVQINIFQGSIALTRTNSWICNSSINDCRMTYMHIYQVVYRSQTIMDIINKTVMKNAECLVSSDN